MDNVSDLNDMRRIRNMEKAIVIYEKQILDLKTAKALLEPHVAFRFFSITCHALTEQQKETATELIKLRIRLDRAKNPAKFEQLSLVSNTQE